MYSNKVIEEKTNTKSHIITIFKFYFYYLAGDKRYLSIAYHKAKTAYEQHPANVDLYLCYIFFNIEMGDLTIATNMINNIKPYISYYKSHSNVYSHYHFLLGLTDVKNQRKSEETILSIEGNYYHLLCYMYIKTDPSHAYTFLDKAFTNGCRSPFLYFCFNKIFNSGRRYYRNKLLLSFLKWATVHNILDKNSIHINSKPIISILQINIVLFIEIYEKFKQNWLLIELCKELVKQNNYTLLAYKLYKELSQKQIYDESLNKSLIFSAYINNIEHISRFSIENFIKSNMEIEIKPFIFHLLITSSHLEGLIETYNLKNEIIIMALKCANSKSTIKDIRFHNTLFRYALEHSFSKSSLGELATIMEESLLKNIFICRVTVKNSNIKHIWVSENTRFEPISYEINSNISYIKVSSKYFRILCLDKDKKNIIQEEPILEKQAPGDYWLYKYFYDKGHINTELLVALSLYYINENIETEESAEILSRTIKIKGLSRSFRMQIIQTLGKTLFAINHYEKALDYYKLVDEFHLNERYIETMFKVFMSTKEYELAIRLLGTKSQYITEHLLFQSLQTLFTKISNQGPKNQQSILIANTSYELLIKGYYSDELLQSVLNHYQGPVLDWCQLSQVLYEKSISNILLDEKILNDAILVRHFSVQVQNVYLRLFNLFPDNEIIKNFTYYICYLVIVTAAHLEEAVVLALKQIYLTKKDSLQLVTLALILQNNEIAQHPSITRDYILEHAMAYLDSKKIFLPAFMELDSKYLTQHQQSQFCAIHYGNNGQNISMCFKIDEYDYKQVTMSYFKFRIFSATIPIFYNESISYYFKSNGEDSQTYNYKNEKVMLQIKPKSDFFKINNAVIFFEMFKYDEMEKLLFEIYKPKEITSYKIL